MRRIGPRIRVAAVSACWICVSACIGPPLDIVPATLPNGIVGEVYEQRLAADDAARWEVAGGDLPPGLELTSGGTLVGAPAQGGEFIFTAAARTAGLPRRTGERTFILNILPRLRLADELEPARVGEPYSDGLDVTGGVPPYTFEILRLPANFTYDAATGVISGTPLVADPAVRIDITVTDSGEPRQSRSTSAELEIRPRAVAIVTASLPDGRVGELYRQTVEITGGQSPYLFSVIAGNLEELELNRFTGEIRGTPGVARTLTFTIEVRDDDDPPTTDTAEYTIVIEP